MWDLSEKITYNYFLLLLASSEVSLVAHDAGLKKNEGKGETGTTEIGGGRCYLRLVQTGPSRGCRRHPCAAARACFVVESRPSHDQTVPCKKSASSLSSSEQHNLGWPLTSSEPCQAEASTYES